MIAKGASSPNGLKLSVALCGGLLLPLSGCRFFQSLSHTTQISDSYNDTAVLGQAYDTTKKKMLNNVCVTADWEPTIIGNSISEIRYEQDMSYSSILKNLDANTNASGNVVVSQASEATQLALDSSSDERSETHVVYWTGINRKKVLPSKKYRLTSTGQDFATHNKNRLQELCGDSFVAEIQYGASIFATLKIEYMNTSDKFLAGKSVNVNLVSGIIKGDGNLEKLDEALKKRTKVSLIVKQLGGNPTGLVRAIPANAIACSLDDLAPCMDTFTKVVTYMQSDFRTVLETGGTGWNALTLVTVPYESSGLEVLTPAGGFLHLDDATINARAMLEMRLVAEQTYAKRAETILQNGKLYPYMTEASIGRIKDILLAANDNIATLNRTRENCYEEVRDCLTIASNCLNQLPVYDASLLSVDLGEKHIVNDINYYNILGGYSFGSKYDDTTAGGPNALVVRMDLNTINLNGGSSTGSHRSDVRLTGVRIVYANSVEVVHGALQPNSTQSIDLSQDPVIYFNVCYDAGSDVLTQRIVGISLQTREGRSLASGNILESKCTAITLPPGEIFVGMAGSSGAEVDSLGPITRTVKGG